jgi:hypothetical protein
VTSNENLVGSPRCAERCGVPLVAQRGRSILSRTVRARHKPTRTQIKPRSLTRLPAPQGGSPACHSIRDDGQYFGDGSAMGTSLRCRRRTSPKAAADQRPGREVVKLPMFGDAYRKRRCILPIDAFFECKAVLGSKVK